MSTISGKSTLVVIFLCSREECSNLEGNIVQFDCTWIWMRQQQIWKQSFVALELGCTWTWRKQQSLVALWSFHLFKWKEATTGSFCIVSCFVLSWWELHLLHLKLSIAHKINDNLLAFTWLSHLILDIDPRCSACVNLLRQKSKEMVEPSAIAGRSREMSQKGSIVVETPLHTYMWNLLRRIWKYS